MIYINIHKRKLQGTNIELLMEAELIRRNISFEPQYPLLNITISDFFIQPNIVIYCDGDYWHSKEEVVEKDKRQNSILASKGYKVFRFTETDIEKSVKDCVEKIFIEKDN